MKIYLPADLFEEQSVEINATDKHVLKISAKINVIDEKPFIVPLPKPAELNGNNNDYIPFSEFNC